MLNLQANCTPALVPPTNEMPGLAVLDTRKHIDQTLQVCPKSLITELCVFHDSTTILHLPNEILNLIFKICCQHNFFSSAWQRCETPTLTLSAVCSRWRSAILNSPWLWTDLSLYLNTSREGWDKIIPPVSYYLQQSLQYPLILDIEMWDGEDGEHGVMDLIVKESRRWRKLRIETGFLSLFSFPSLKAVQSLPLLESLEIQQYSDADFPPELNIFKIAPRLHTLFLDAFHPQDITSQVDKFPWGQIRHLELEAGVTGPLFGALGWCPQLASVSFVNLGRYFRGSLPVVPQTSAVRSLSIGLACMSATKALKNLELLIKSLTLPSVTSLSIEAGRVRRPFVWPQEAFKTFILRSGCSLTSLRLEGVLIPSQTVVALLELLPTLLNLTIQEQERSDRNEGSETQIISSDFLQSLCTRRDDAFCLLPMLEHLNLTVNGDRFDDAAYVNMVAFRYGNGKSSRQVASPLRSIELHVMGHVFRSKGTYCELLGFRKMGLDVVLR